MTHPYDPGLQPQRTALAWARTAVAAGTNGLLLLRAGIVGGDRAVTALAVGVLAGALLMVALSHRRRSRLASHGSGATPTLALQALAGGTFLAAAGAALAGLLGAFR